MSSLHTIFLMYIPQASVCLFPVLVNSQHDYSSQKNSTCPAENAANSVQVSLALIAQPNVAPGYQVQVHSFYVFHITHKSPYPQTCSFTRVNLNYICTYLV